MERPKRPLSAYNYFFKAERIKLLGLNVHKISEKDGSGKRKHRKTPGMIGFRGLASQVGERWKSLSDAEREPYVHMFENDRARYKKEMQVWRRIQTTSLVYKSAPNLMCTLERRNIVTPTDVIPSTISSSFSDVNLLRSDRNLLINKSHGVLQHMKMPGVDFLQCEVDPIPIQRMTSTLNELEREIMEFLNASDAGLKWDISN